LNRRDFIVEGAKLAAGTALIGLPGLLDAGSFKTSSELVVLFTNDWHSHIDPFPMDGSKNQGLGGAAKRAALINSIRKQHQHVLLLDSGDIFQGTPYFNYFGGELEFKLMSEMGYDAATMGNHDFDNGLEGFDKYLKHAKFPFLCANYDFSDTILDNKTQPYKIFHKGKYKVGVFGLGIDPKNLIPDNLFGKTIFLDPLNIANETAHFLRHKKNCNLIICISHLGYKYDSSKISDLTLASSTKYIDLILGGHTHTFLDTPVEVINSGKEITTICQTGWGGINLGKVHYGLINGQEGANAYFSMLKIC